MTKTKSSYQDNVERILVNKWMIQASTESGLPGWLSHELLEMCLCECLKAQWHQPFNRYAWIVEREYSGYDMAYHSDHIQIVGLVLGLKKSLEAS